ncbi:MAG: UDP-N-acetylmuramate dehydrogenase [Spirochaetia bacterium]|jgi:UDP-N-acetylmuramate dehydrogenase|nr:UDP-N-acetylmuramate dehydrogenase [Spirochaetia bacterium]
MNTLRKFIDKSNIDALIAFDEPMSAHTTFRIGGPADAFVRPRSTVALSTLLTAAHAEGIPIAVVGGGANLLVADQGVRGIVVSTELLRTSRLLTDNEAGSTLYADAGLPVVDLVSLALQHGLSGLEFAAGLPGSLGGTVYMNARCYEKEFADLLTRVDYLQAGTWLPSSLGIERGQWSYKRTPFMPGGNLYGAIVTGASLELTPGEPREITARMAELEADRAKKGHFDLPCAGSLFKNNHDFGRPTGRILDELGFRGRRVGDAMVSLKHANIFVNAGRASAADMLALIGEAKTAARLAYDIELETEVVMLGEF